MRLERCFLLVCRDLDHSGELALGFSDPYAPIPAARGSSIKPQGLILNRPFSIPTRRWEFCADHCRPAPARRPCGGMTDPSMIE